MMRRLIRLAISVALISQFAMVVADPSYVQALPSNTTQTNTANATQTATATDAFSQPIVQQPTPSTPKTQQTNWLQHNKKKAQPSLSPMDDAAQSTLLLSRVMQVNQDFLNFQSKTAQQINQLQSQNQQTTQQISTLASQLALLQTKVTALTQVLADQKPQATQQSALTHVEQDIGAIPFYIICGIFILLVVIIVILLLPKKKTTTEPAKVDMKSDYDYLSTKEAIPAKLDLARSYIVMEDFEGAKKVLQEVLKEGDDQQKKLAEELLAECKTQTKDD